MDDNKGQNNTNRQVGGSVGAPIDFFNNAPGFAYIYRKCEKIVTALYMITGFLSDKEPLKWQVRKLAGEMLSLTNLLKDRFSTRRDEVVHDIRSHVLELSSLLDIARFAGLMSDMNAEVLQKELALLGKLFEQGDRFQMSSESLLIDSSFFNDPARKEDLPPAAARQQEKPASADKGQKNNSVLSGNRNQADKSDKADKKDKRREAIMAIIRRKGSVTIKDISLSVQEVSEKTIQRELLALVDEGTLRKEGERRWSKYFLAA